MLFFALSGFLMTHLYISELATSRTILDYIVARVGRVYPLFAFAVVLAWLLTLVGFDYGHRMSTSDMGWHLMLAAGNVGVLWTITIEFQFYAIFVLIWIAYSKWGGWRVAIPLWGFVAGQVAVGFLGPWLTIVPQLHLFLAGVAAAFAWKYVRPFGLIADAFLGVLLVGYVLTFPGMLEAMTGARFEGYRQLWPAVLMGLLVLTSAAADGPFSRLLGSRVMVHLGEISFGLYLFHHLTGKLLSSTGVPLPRPVWAVLILLATVAVAEIAHIVIERPARRLIRSLGRSRQSTLKPV